MNRDEFMELIYETFADEPDNMLANGIIEAADAYVEYEKAQCSQIVQPNRQNGRIFQEIIVEYLSSTYPGYEGKPYFSIKYMEDEQAYIGYGTYKPEVLSEYLKMYFISAQPDVPDINVGNINKFIDGLEEIFADIREKNVDDSVCGLCEYDGAYMGQSGDWCNECPGFDRDDCFKLSDKIKQEWKAQLSQTAQPERKTGWWKEITASDCSGYDPALAGYSDHVVGYVCSNCGDGYEKEVMGETTWNYCPNCGADMRGEKDEHID